MRIKIRHIETVLAIISVIMTSEQAYAQKQGLPGATDNVLKYRYQQYKNSLPRYPKGYPMISRMYSTLGAGVEANWEASSYTSDAVVGSNVRWGLGYKFTPVHALEANFMYASTSFLEDGLFGTVAPAHRNSYGVELNYMMNVTAFGKRSDTYNRFEVYAGAGLSYRHALKSMVGINTSLRIQYNPIPSLGIYLEPRVSVLRHKTKQSSIATLPAIQAGVSVWLQQPRMQGNDFISSSVLFDDIAENIPPFALKTNLLFDLATALNVEVEVPIWERFSVAAEWIFPWWTLDNKKQDSKRSRLQVLNGNLEGRYWFGNREAYRLLNGWFAGFYAGGGLYDVEWKGNGVQGEFFIAAGLSGGFAHAITKRLSMEYALGVGLLRTDYRTYEAHYCDDNTWYPIKENRGRYTWIGPTRLKVSLVWLINGDKKKGGSR